MLMHYTFLQEAFGISGEKSVLRDTERIRVASRVIVTGFGREIRVEEFQVTRRFRDFGTGREIRVEEFQVTRISEKFVLRDTEGIRVASRVIVTGSGYEE